MKSRLNLTIDEEVLLEIKKVAVRNGTTLSDLVENYFKKMLPRTKHENVVDMVDKLHPAGISPDIDLEKLYYQQKGKNGPKSIS